MIGATTLTEYRKYIEKDAAFERRFQQVLVNEPTVPETISILRGLKEKYESHHGVSVSSQPLLCSTTLTKRVLQDCARLCARFGRSTRSPLPHLAKAAGLGHRSGRRGGRRRQGDEGQPA